MGKQNTWDGWQTKRKIGRRRVSISLPAKTVKQMFDVWHFAKDIKKPFNRLITIRPHLINTLTPAERIVYWEDDRNRMAQFARDNGFEHVIVWSRESTRHSGEDEHLHALIHIPEPLAGRFETVALGWYGGSDEIDIRPADYRQRRQPSGKLHSALSYIAKNSPQAARFGNLSYRLGGPILGKRAGWSRNVGPTAQARFEARHLIRRAFGHSRAIADIAA